jgi:uncharacterized protein YndB with AHSA1/START domain/predicted enzyme related to lactoylglutathione lyase
MSGDPAHRLTITRRFDAAPERVFDAWLDPAVARQWLFTSPDTDITARRVEIDARVGGKWLMTNPCEGMELEGVGEYQEIDRPRRLVFTFAIPMFGPDVDRIVVEIVPDGAGCLLTLTHEKLPLEFHDGTRSGWGKMFKRLDAIVAVIRRPTRAHGKICYLEIPALDVGHSADFYCRSFGWTIRQRSDGSTAFDDSIGEVSGSWVLGRPPAAAPGLLIYIMVDSVAATIDAVIANGGRVVQPIGADAPEITARVSDPAGNVIGLYQEPDRARDSKGATTN